MAVFSVNFGSLLNQLLCGHHRRTLVELIHLAPDCAKMQGDVLPVLSASIS